MQHMLLFLAGLASTSIAAAAATPFERECELHVWPTRQVAAAFQGVALFPKAGGFLKPEQRALMETQARVEAAIDPDAQLAVLTAGDGVLARRFAGFRLVAHPAPAERTDTEWLRKDFGEGPRRTASGSTCYAELHVAFVTLLKRDFNQKLQAVFLLRWFGAAPVAGARRVDGVGSDTPGFRPGTVSSPDDARILRDAFARDAASFLARPRTVKLLALADAAARGTGYPDHPPSR